MAQGDPTITIIGNIVADPELRFTQNGKAVANFRIASTPRQYDRDQQKYIDGTPTFLTCNLWGTPAENLAESLHKGDRVIVTGTLKQRTWQDKNGENRTTFEVEADEVGPSIRFATTQVNRASRGGGQGGYNQNNRGNTNQQDPWNTNTTNNSEPPF
ncbi:single-stranded DNA-binding protein [Corynebacterium auriscanis]|uniref:single-stranded DNA-binding protein n=1 Tax=Corynebacterium auriscanis TaxID=99807 RepID=UPI003CFB4329